MKDTPMTPLQAGVAGALAASVVYGVLQLVILFGSDSVEQKKTNNDLIISESNKCVNAGMRPIVEENVFLLGNRYQVVCKTSDVSLIERYELMLEWEERAAKARDKVERIESGAPEKSKLPKDGRPSRVMM